MSPPEPGADPALVRQLAPKPDEPPLRLRQGVIQAIARPTCTVRPSGSEDPADDVAGVSYYESALPLSVGDVVEILAHGADWRVVGIVRRAGATPTSVTWKQATAGSVTVNTGTAYETFYAPTTDMPIEAAAGDLIEVTFTVHFLSGSTPPWFRPRFSASARLFAPGGMRPPANLEVTRSGTWLETVVAADLTAGVATVQPMWINSGAGNTVYATAAIPARFWTKNLGPPR